MSKWRAKGFVQDSDEEEEDFELSTTSSPRDSQHSVTVREPSTTSKTDHGEPTTSPKSASAREAYISEHGASALHEERRERTPCDAPAAVTQVAQATPVPTPAKSSAVTAIGIDVGGRSESPDPLQRSPSPKAKRVDRLSHSSQILGITTSSPGTQRQGPSGNNNEERKNAFLFDDSGDSDLSDPPSDLDELCPNDFRYGTPIREAAEPLDLARVEQLDMTSIVSEGDGSHLQETIFASPTRRSTVQVVIPPSTSRERRPEVFDRYVERSFRERKPIQLHPYLLEGERYRQELKGRGVKPVIRVLSPPRKALHNEEESQEQEFDPSRDMVPHSSPEIPVSTPIGQSRIEGGRGSSSQRRFARPQRLNPTLGTQRSAKRRKLEQPPGRLPGNGTRAVADVWAVPQSPPYSSSPPINHSVTTTRIDTGRSIVTPVADIPTPSTSSSVLAVENVESDEEPVRSVQRLAQRAHHPISILSDSSSSDTEVSENEAPASDHELRKVGKKIRGVLPASWLRLDLQAQEKRDKKRMEQLNALQSPGHTEPQRGVAQRVVRRQNMSVGLNGQSPATHRIIELSDESDSDADTPRPQASNVQESARAAFETAAMLDRRYADEDSDNMEDNRLHLFTLGGGEKRKKQSKLTEMLTASTKRRPRGESHLRSRTSKQQKPSKRRRQTPPLALSILDIDQSPSNDRPVPKFLRVAKRQARRRPDFARDSPTNKYIRLHTAQDTQEANAALLDWRRGAIKPRAHIAQVGHGTAPRRPLADVDRNPQSPLSVTNATLQSKVQPISMVQGSPSSRRRRPSSDSPHVRGQGQGDSSRDEKHAPASTQKMLSHYNRARPLPFRNAQLEGLETDHGSGNRRIAFQRGLQRVDQQFDLQQPLLQTSRNPQIARFLADDDVSGPTLPSIESVETPVLKTPVSKVAVPKRRLVRKPRAQRVDVETREYRQPTEPAAGDYLRGAPSDPAPGTEAGQSGPPLLQGLGPHGTRYSTTFDVLPVPDGTYFHVSTFVGSGALRQSLTGSRSNARSLDVPVGYCDVDFYETTKRCGPWEDDIAARLAASTNAIWNGVPNQHKDDVSFSSLDSCFDQASALLRSLNAYISTHLSFHDPIDRKTFVVKMEQWAASMFESVLSKSAPDTKSAQLVKARPLSLLLVLTLQIYNIADHSVVEPSARSDLATLLASVGKSLVGDILDHVSDLSDFLENIKRYKVRENGIQDTDVIVESLVICSHTLSETSLPGCTFWDFVGQSLSPAAKRAIHLMEFESIWGTVFTLLPFVEFNELGIPSRDRRISFKEDNWSVIRGLLQRTFVLYPETSKASNASLNEYIRAIMTRCHELIYSWHWNRCDPVLYTMFDFFVAKNGLRHLKRESIDSSVDFIERIDKEVFGRIQPNARSFHIFLKCLYLGLQGMRDCYPEKKIRSVVLRLIPNHGRSYPKDQPLEVGSLEALQNHHNILCTLYRASPLPCRPSLELLKNLVHHETSHREACRISIRAWANLARFQLSTDEPYSALQPLAQWHQDIKTQTLKQYRLAKTEAEEYLKSSALNNSEATSVMVKQTMEKNQDQVISALRDCMAGLLNAVSIRKNQHMLKDFLVDAGLVQVLELPHLQDRRLVVVIRDALRVLREFVGLTPLPVAETAVVEQDEESQDYGESFDLADVMEVDDVQYFLQSPLWHLLSNAFGAESSPDDNLLMDCIDTWCLTAHSQVSLRTRSWTYYLDSFSQVSWQQLRRTEQTKKFRPYFMASILGFDGKAYSQHRLDFLNALLVSLVDRESMLRFQHRLLGAIIESCPGEPLLQNVPFYDLDGKGSLDIRADTVRERRLSLLSTILANMQSSYHNRIHEDFERLAEIRGSYSALLKDMMNAMKYNYQQLGSGTTVTGAYVEFVQRIVQFLQQYTADIYPVLDFFTNSVAFPLPAADPTYVVGRLCGYAPKLSRPGIPKQLSVFVQTVAQQAATGGHQSYLVHQLCTVLCTDETPLKDRNALRDTLLQGIFPAYIEAAFTSAIGFVIAQPILQSLAPTIKAMQFNLRVFDETNIGALCDSLLAISHVFFRNIERIKDNDELLRCSHILQSLSLMFQIASPISVLLQYICGRCSDAPEKKPAVTEYLESMALFVGETLHDITPQTIPSYRGDASQPDTRTKATELLSFSVDGLHDGIRTNWGANGDVIYFGQGHARREVVVDWKTVDEARAELVGAIEMFLAGAEALDGGTRYDECDGGLGWLGGLDV